MSKTGRNDPCPCGSGKKFKKCCENKTAIQRRSFTALTPEKVKKMDSVIGRISGATSNQEGADLKDRLSSSNKKNSS